MISGIARIVDGDTLDVGAIRIRLHGIDATEAGQTCKRANGRAGRKRRAGSRIWLRVVTSSARRSIETPTAVSSRHAKPTASTSTKL
jgi:endonuclease YncB( thermonuclease family)